MTDRPDPEALILEELTESERRALLAAVDAGEVAAVERLATLLSSLDQDDWRAAEKPALRFVPEGAGQAVPFWSRVCVRGDAGEHRVGAPVIAVGLVALMLLSAVAGFVLRGGADEPDPAAVADARLERAPAVSLVRMGEAPRAAGGVIRMVGGAAGSGGSARVALRAHGLPATEAGRWYELWMLRDARHMVSVGTFRVRADGTVATRFRVRVDPSRFPTMDVSVQTKADGSAHSGRSVLRSSPAT